MREALRVEVSHQDSQPMEGDELQCLWGAELYKLQQFVSQVFAGETF